MCVLLLLSDRRGGLNLQRIIWAGRMKGTWRGCKGVILWSTLSLSPITHLEGLVPQILFISYMINRPLLNVKWTVHPKIKFLIPHIAPSLTFFSLFCAITMYQDWGFQALTGLKSTLKDRKCVSDDLCTIFLVLLCEAIQ